MLSHDAACPTHPAILANTSALSVLACCASLSIPPPRGAARARPSASGASSGTFGHVTGAAAPQTQCEAECGGEAGRLELLRKSKILAEIGRVTPVTAYQHLALLPRYVLMYFVCL